jgi:phosphoesterase RecJ-like protein
MAESALVEAARVIRGADELSLACHVNPDGDAIGSLLAVAAAASAQGKRVRASFGSPFVLAETYRYLPLELLVAPQEMPSSPEVMVCFDAASLDRLGDLARAGASARCLIVVDHHVSNPGFGSVNLVDPQAAASAELTHALIRSLGWPIDEVVATCLYTGLVTDTGRFQYSNTRSGTLRLAAELVEAGARPEVISRHMYEEVPFGYLSVAGAVMSRAELEPGDGRSPGWVWSRVRPEDLRTAGIGPADLELLIDLVRLPREAEVAVLAKEHEDGTVKMSLRSRGGVDVGAIASALGGGGHHNASGFTWKGTTEDALGRIREIIRGD